MRVMEMLPSAACWRMASSWRDRPARAVQHPTKTVAAAIPVGLLDGGSACFETPPSAAPQHEDFFFVPSKIDLILRSAAGRSPGRASRSEEQTSELQSLMRISYAVFRLQ